MSSTELDGNDVSKWQGAVDWTQAAQQTGFVIVKASQGTAELDPDYPANISALRARGVRRGSYHYPDGFDPIAEADHYVAAAGRRDGEMQALDFEGYVLTLVDPVGWAHAFLARVIERTGNRPLIYMSANTVTRFDWRRVIALNVGLWVASWDSPPVEHIGQWPFAIMWQRDDHGSLRGVAGRVDEDVFWGDPVVWQHYASNITDPINQPPAPKPTPPPAPVPPPAPKPTAPTHTVVAGDTLLAIAHACHPPTTVAELVALNEHAHPSLGWNPDLIQVGWVLTLPGAPAPTPAPAPHVGFYRVEAGDTLDGLAAEFHTTVDELVRLNHAEIPQLATDPNHIEVGWVLRVP